METESSDFSQLWLSKQSDSLQVGLRGWQVGITIGSRQKRAASQMQDRPGNGMTIAADIIPPA